MAVKTWIWIIVGVIAACVLGLVLIAGAGLYFVSHHIGIQRTTNTAALREFDTARAPFKEQPPLIEIDPADHPRETRATTSLPSSSVRPQNLHLLAWDEDEHRLARITLPFWILRFGMRKMDLPNDADFNLDQLNLDLPELERIGPALLVDHRTPEGSRVLIWTQ
jgi:hypothetical protein